jgi:hypothetical protein
VLGLLVLVYYRSRGREDWLRNAGDRRVRDAGVAAGGDGGVIGAGGNATMAGRR